MQTYVAVAAVVAVLVILVIVGYEVWKKEKKGGAAGTVAAGAPKYELMNSTRGFCLNEKGALVDCRATAAAWALNSTGQLELVGPAGGTGTCATAPALDYTTVGTTSCTDAATQGAPWKAAPAGPKGAYQLQLAPGRCLNTTGSHAAGSTAAAPAYTTVVGPCTDPATANWYPAAR